MASSLGVHERSSRVSLTGVLPLGGGTDHVLCDLVWLVESVGGALGVGEAPDSDNLEEGRGGARAVLTSPASHHHLHTRITVTHFPCKQPSEREPFWQGRRYDELSSVDTLAPTLRLYATLPRS